MPCLLREEEVTFNRLHEDEEADVGVVRYHERGGKRGPFWWSCPFCGASGPVKRRFGDAYRGMRYHRGLWCKKSGGRWMRKR